MPGRQCPQRLVDIDSVPEGESAMFAFEDLEQGRNDRPSPTSNNTRLRSSNHEVKSLTDFSDHIVKLPSDHADEEDEDLDISVSKMLPLAQDMTKHDAPAKMTSALTSTFNEDRATRKLSGSQKAQLQDHGDGFESAPLARAASSNRQIPEDEVELIEAFKNKFSGLKLRDHDANEPVPHKMRLRDVLDTFDRETQRKLQNGEEDDHFDNLALSPPPLATEDDDDWEKIDEELDAETQRPVPIPTVVYQNASFKATVQEYIDRYSLSSEQKETLQGVWTILKWAGEFGYAAVSEPIVDAAEWAVEKQIGCDLDGLPMELRMRLRASQPQNVQNAIRVTNSVAGRSAEVAALSYHHLSSAVRAMSETPPQVDSVIARNSELDDGEVVV